MRTTLSLLLLMVSLLGQELPPLPPISMNGIPVDGNGIVRPNIIMVGSSLVLTNPEFFREVDWRITNKFGWVDFMWTENTEPDLAGYHIYYGPASRTYTNFVTIGLTNRGRVENLSRTNRNYFGLTAFNTAGLESMFATNELSWPNPLFPPGYTNFVVIVPYEWTTNLVDGPWEEVIVRVHFYSWTNSPIFWRSKPLRVERTP